MWTSTVLGPYNWKNKMTVEPLMSKPRKWAKLSISWPKHTKVGDPGSVIPILGQKGGPLIQASLASHWEGRWITSPARRKQSGNFLFPWGPRPPAAEQYQYGGRAQHPRSNGKHGNRNYSEWIQNEKQSHQTNRAISTLGQFKRTIEFATRVPKGRLQILEEIMDEKFPDLLM